MDIKKAAIEDVEGICSVCSAGWRDAHANLYCEDHINKAAQQFYSRERVQSEVLDPRGWNGWYVAIDNGRVVGAGGGTSMNGRAELWVLYLDPQRRREAIGTKLLTKITDECRSQGAGEQWLSVAKGNDKGIPFYEAMGFRVAEEQEQWFNEVYRHVVLRMQRPI